MKIQEGSTGINTFEAVSSIMGSGTQFTETLSNGEDPQNAVQKN